MPDDGGMQYWQQFGQYQQEQEMGRYASDTGEMFEQAPTGNHVARCIALIDLGTQHGEYQGRPNTRNQVLIRWELSNELMTDSKPFSVSRFYTNSLSEKANLRKDLESWRGRAFTADELERFDLQTILGKPCMLNVVQNDKGRAVVSSIATIPKGMSAPDCINAPFAFWIDEWDDKVFESIPDGLKKIIAASDEYKARGKPQTTQTAPAGSIDEEIPF
jgi:hypothetical protein